MNNLKLKNLSLSSIFITTVVAILGSTSSVVAATAYTQNNKIYYNNVVYKFAGKDTRADSNISNWSIYLAEGFKCGQDIIVDNPENSGTVALRGTGLSAGQGNPVIGDCITVAKNMVISLVDVSDRRSCQNAGFEWAIVDREDGGCLIKPDSNSVSSPDLNNARQPMSTASEAATKIDTECDNIDDPSKPCQMLVYLKNGINFLSAVAGIAITFSLIWAGYQYMTARANAGIVTAAKNRIIMTLVALLLYIFMYAILNWLIPGGLFS